MNTAHNIIARVLITIGVLFALIGLFGKLYVMYVLSSISICVGIWLYRKSLKEDDEYENAEL